MPKKPAERFPGFVGSMVMLRNRKDAEAQEAGYHWLLPRVGEFVEPLLAELEAERDPYMQGWILELLGKARDARAFPTFIQHLLSPDASVRGWAETALRQLGQTREGRKVLWSAHQQQEFLALPAVCDEQFVREVLVGHTANRLPSAVGLTPVFKPDHRDYVAVYMALDPLVASLRCRACHRSP